MLRLFAVVVVVAACSSEPAIEVVPGVVDEVVGATELPSTLTCGVEVPELARIYVGGYASLVTACQGSGAKTVVVLGDAGGLVTELARRFRVIVPELRAEVSEQERVMDLVMLIRKTNAGPVYVAGNRELVDLFRESHPELVVAVVGDRGSSS